MFVAIPPTPVVKSLGSINPARLSLRPCLLRISTVSWIIETGVSKRFSCAPSLTAMAVLPRVLAVLVPVRKAPSKSPFPTLSVTR